MLSCKVTNCDKGIQKPPGQCANPLGLSWDGTSNFKIPDSAFSSPAHLSPGMVEAITSLIFLCQ